RMRTVDLVIRGKRVLLPPGVSTDRRRLVAGGPDLSAEELVPASIHIRDQRILAIKDYEEIPSDCIVHEADDQAVVMPGLVDTHVHINEPGRTGWEGFSTATLAAAAGGVTTLIDMPLNSIPPTTSVAGLQAKLDRASDRSYVDVGFWGG